MGILPMSSGHKLTGETPVPQLRRHSDGCPLTSRPTRAAFSIRASRLIRQTPFSPVAAVPQRYFPFSGSAAGSASGLTVGTMGSGGHFGGAGVGTFSAATVSPSRVSIHVSP